MVSLLCFICVLANIALHTSNTQDLFISTQLYKLSNPFDYSKNTNSNSNNSSIIAIRNVTRSVTVEKEETLNTVCNKKCKFPFTFKRYDYKKCTTYKKSKPWCVANQEIFDNADNWRDSNGNALGWNYCPSDCPVEHHLCNECHPKFEYKGKILSGCTIDDDHTWPWCVVNVEKFSNDITRGWEHCSWECAKNQVNEDGKDPNPITTTVYGIIFDDDRKSDKAYQTNFTTLYNVNTELKKSDSSLHYQSTSIMVSVTILLLAVLMLTVCFFKSQGFRSEDNINNLNAEIELTEINSSKDNKTETLEDVHINLITYKTIETIPSDHVDHSNVLVKDSVAAHKLSDVEYLKLMPENGTDSKSLTPPAPVHYSLVENSSNSVVEDYFGTLKSFGKREIERSEFKLEKLLGRGNFGFVFQGSLIDPVINGSWKTIAIKTLNNPFSSEKVSDFIYEVKIMSRLENHQNLVNMIGTYTSDHVKDGEIFIMMEYCKHGDLKQFLIRNRDNFISTELKSNDTKCIKLHCCLLVLFAHDAAKGMEYLAQNKIMHGDLAARNILLGTTQDNHLIAKVSDFGLSKHLYDNLWYKKEKRTTLPWRWMAFELFKDGLLTMNSDVWSYGILIWEILSLGEIPYPGKSNDEVLKLLKQGYRLPCPEVANNFPSWPFEMFYILITEKCFVENPLERACFSDIIALVEECISCKDLELYRKKSFSTEK